MFFFGQVKGVDGVSISYGVFRAYTEMVRVIPREEYIDLTLNRKGYHVETSEYKGVWTAYFIGDRLGVVCKAHGKTRLEALEALAGELGVRV